LTSARSEKARLARIYQRLGRLYGKRRRTNFGTTLEQLVLTVLTSEAKEPQGIRALCLLQDEYVDWNEVRISPDEILREELAGVGVNSAAPSLLKQTLEGVLQETASLEPDVLDAFSPQEFIAILNKIDFPKALTASLVLAREELRKGVKPPVDSGVARVMWRVGLVGTPRATNQVSRCIEEMVPQSEQGNFHRTVGLLARKHCTSGEPFCRNCPLRRDCSFHSSRVSGSTGRSARSPRRVAANRRSRPPSHKC